MARGESPQPRTSAPCGKSTGGELRYTRRSARPDDNVLIYMGNAIASKAHSGSAIGSSVNDCAVEREPPKPGAQQGRRKSVVFRSLHCPSISLIIRSMRPKIVINLRFRYTARRPVDNLTRDLPHALHPSPTRSEGAAGCASICCRIQRSQGRNIEMREEIGRARKWETATPRPERRRFPQ